MKIICSSYKEYSIWNKPNVNIFCLQCQEYWPENENEMKEYEHMCITTLDQAKALDSRKRPLVDTVQRTFELVDKNKGTYFILFSGIHSVVMT